MKTMTTEYHSIQELSGAEVDAVGGGGVWKEVGKIIAAAAAAAVAGFIAGKNT